MKRKRFSISLQNRLVLTYALFTGIALSALAVVVNVLTGLIFTALVKNNITAKSAEIVSFIGGQYKPMSAHFDAAAIEAAGMYFVHEGYIITVEDEGGIVWDARACNMRECMTVVNGIEARMAGRFGGSGGLRQERYPVQYAGKTVGTVTIETYGPFFYSETESAFLTSINRLLFFAAITLTLASLAVSMLLARAIARPVNKSAEAARHIAAHAGNAGSLLVRIDDNYHTRELAELAGAINGLAARLAEAERRQKQLTSDIAHELRTPLTCLQGGIEAMIDGVYTPDKNHLESCHEEIIRLTGLVKDLNTLTSLEWESITLNKTAFDLADLLRVTAEQFRPAALEKGITITLRLAASPISADYERLKQVFINLLSNAVKYTDSGCVTISVENTGREAFDESKDSEIRRQVSVCVSDTGIGIPECDLPHVFERFYRTDKSRGRGTGGAGIGLTIAAAIVAAHGGTITAESAGQGSVFRVLL